jgi:hypothetical protein
MTKQLRGGIHKTNHIYTEVVLPNNHTCYNVKKFLQAQRCAWLRRALDLNEIWKMHLFVRSPNNLLMIDKSMFDAGEHPVLFTIAESIKKMRIGHSKFEKNYKKAIVFNNSAFNLGIHSRACLNTESWGPGMDVETEQTLSILRYFRTGW